MTEKGWKEIEPGGLVREAGSSVEYKTGSWRSWRPIIDLDKCNYCLTCWAYCPDASIIVEGGKVLGVNLDYCKGCGICARECPQEAITMIEETKAKAEES